MLYDRYNSFWQLWAFITIYLVSVRLKGSCVALQGQGISSSPFWALEVYELTILTLSFGIAWSYQCIHLDGSMALIYYILVQQLLPYIIMHS